STDKQTFDNADYPDLPTPEQLQAANADNTNDLVTGVVPAAAPATIAPAAPAQPQNADALADQSGGAVTTAPSDVAPGTEPGSGDDNGQDEPTVAAQLTADDLGNSNDADTSTTV